MSSDGGRHLPRRPVRFGPDALEAHGGTLPGPAEITEVAHQTAAILVGTGRAAHDPEVTSRLVTLVDDLGLSTVADLWSARPARSLPGALWRLYALREWVRRSPEQASREYAAGIRFTDVAHAVAGIPEPPQPEEMQRVADQILAGVFEGDLAVALERAAAFCSVVAAGRAELANDRDAADPGGASDLTRSGAAMLTTGEDLGRARTCGAPATSTDRPDHSARMLRPGTHAGRRGVSVVCGCRAAAAPGPNISRYERPRAVRRSRSGTHSSSPCGRSRPLRSYAGTIRRGVSHETHRSRLAVWPG